MKKYVMQENIIDQRERERERGEGEGREREEGREGGRKGEIKNTD